MLLRWDFYALAAWALCATLLIPLPPPLTPNPGETVAPLQHSTSAAVGRDLLFVLTVLTPLH